MNSAELASAINLAYVMVGIVLVGFILLFLVNKEPSKKSRKK